MKKRILSFLIMLCMITALLPANITVFAATVDSGTCGNNLTWNLDSSGTLTISGTGDMTSWTSSISVPWYSSRNTIKTIVIGGNVTSIGRYAFYNCTNLTSITIGKNIASIGEQAFSATSNSSANVYISDLKAYLNIDFYHYFSVPTYYAPNLYLNKELLTDVVIPNGVETIREYVFYNNTNITSVTIPDSVTSIGEYAFSGCTGLTNVTIGDHVTSIENYAFYNCTALEKIYWNAKNVTDFSLANNIFEKAGTNGNGIEVFFGDSVETIPAYVFKLNATTTAPKIVSITIGNSVSSIHTLAFDTGNSIVTYATDLNAALDHISLKSIKVSENNEYYSSDNNGILYNKGKTKLIKCPAKSSTTNFVIPNSVTSIEDSAFRYCTRLTEITIPDSVISIGNYAFEQCNSLTHVTIPNGVENIGTLTFRYCSSLTEITIPNSVTSIGYRAFEYCNSLTSVTIPGSVTSIGNYAFRSCSSLASIIVSENNEYYSSGNDGVLYNEDKTKLIQYPIGRSQTDFVISNSVANIGDYAFAYCDTLTSLTIGENVTSIGDYAFSYCTALKKYIGMQKMLRIFQVLNAFFTLLGRTATE